MINLSVVINTKNSGETIKRTLASVNSWADEIVVVDMESTDDTVKIASEFTDKIFFTQDVGYVEPARNFAIKKANGIWVLILDSDEEVPKSLQEKITQLITQDDADCYYLPRRNIIFDKWIEHTNWWPDYVLRLFKKEYVAWTNEIHSIPITTGKVMELSAKPEWAIIHHNYQHVAQFVDRLNKYTSIEAKEESQFDSSSLINNFRSDFISRFFYSHGYLDGTHGLALSLLQGFYELVKSLKVWEKNGFKQENVTQATIDDINQLARELQYWTLTYQIEHSSGIKKLWSRIKRKYFI